MWGHAGPLFVVQGYGANSDDKCVDMLDKLEAFMDEGGLIPTLTVVERPYIGQSDTEFKASIIANAMATGRCVDRMSRRGPVSSVVAPTWRARLGMAGLGRAKAKKVAIALASRAHVTLGLEVPAGPKGGEWEHALEGCCISMAAWRMAGLKGSPLAPLLGLDCLKLRK